MRRSDPIDKRKILKVLRTKLEADLLNARTSQAEVQHGATHEEARQEDPKDTRAIEAGYLARGMAERVEQLQEAASRFAHLEVVDFGPDDPIGVTALVALDEAEEEEGEDEEDAETIYFLVPHVGGETVVLDGTPIRTLTPTAPLAQALLGKHVDDEIEVELPTRTLVATIVWVR